VHVHILLHTHYMSADVSPALPGDYSRLLAWRS
jgi:hypothetical protein